MKRVFVILLAAMLLTGCTSENIRAIQSSSTNITITTYNDYSVQGYTIREIGDGYVIRDEQNRQKEQPANRQMGIEKA